MPTSPWYQFSLRSLLLLTVFVAALCGLGIYTHWLLAAIIGLTVMCGGITGWLVARTRLGFAQGIVFAVQFVLLVGLFLLLPLGFLRSEWPRWLLCAVTAVVASVSGVVGEFTVRPWTGK
jgi:predicted Co/Zn/Cd cation transporter (cation efflux family)